MSEPRWSEDQERMLQHEAFVSEVIKRRQESKAELEPGTMLRFLQSNGGTAVITILLGSLLAPIVISFVQSSAAHNDQALSEYKQYLEHQQESVKETYDLVGGTIFATGDLIAITKPAFNPPPETKGIDRPALDKQVREIIANFNAAVKEWRVKKNIQGLLVSYYFYGQPGVLKAWRGAEQSIDNFVACAETRHENFWKNPSLVLQQPDECQSIKDKIEPTLESLAQSIEVSRRYNWQQFEVPTPTGMQPSLSPHQTPSPSPLISP